MSGDTLLLDSALDFAATRGRPVFPVKQDKTPYTKHGFKDATKDPSQIKAWWKKWPDAGIGTPTGPEWFVLDVDDEKALEALVAEHGPLPPTIVVVTPRPGLHIYLRGKATNTTGRLPKGIDVRGVGGYVLLPPSPHENGTYEWRTAPDEAEMGPCPEWLAKLLEIDKRSNGAAPPVEGDIPEQQRDNTLTSMAGTMRRRGFSERAILAALTVENADRCKPPLDDAQVRKIAHSAARYKPADDAVPSFDRLNALTGLTAVGKSVDRIGAFGRGSRADVYFHLDDGGQIEFKPLGAFTTANKMNAELALQAGARPGLDAPKMQELLTLIHGLADHQRSVEIADRSWELGSEYLKRAADGNFVFDDQESKWTAFSRLDCHEDARKRGAADIVLVDTVTGKRYVRTQWFTEYLKPRTNTGEPDRMMKELERLGWFKPGREGRIKATSPTMPRTLQWAFFVVPKGWEDE